MTLFKCEVSCHMRILDVTGDKGTRGELGTNSENAVTLVMEMTMLNLWTPGADFSAEDGTGEEDTSMSAPFHAYLVKEGASCSGLTSEEHGMHETNGTVPLDKDEARHSEIHGGY